MDGDPKDGFGDGTGILTLQTTAMLVPSSPPPDADTARKISADSPSRTSTSYASDGCIHTSFRTTSSSRPDVVLLFVECLCGNGLTASSTQRRT